MIITVSSTTERFWTKVDKTSGCWLWMGALNTTGYGLFHFKIGESMRVAHRVAWEFECGEIPKGLNVLHRCDVRACVNPAHLFLGTRSDNMRDMADKRRHPYCRLNDAEVQGIRAALASGEKHKDVAVRFGVSRSHVTMIANGKKW